MNFNKNRFIKCSEKYTVYPFMKIQNTDLQSMTVEMKHHSILHSVGNIHLNLIAEMKEKIEKLENDICRYKASGENGSRIVHFFRNYNFESDALH